MIVNGDDSGHLEHSSFRDKTPWSYFNEFADAAEEFGPDLFALSYELFVTNLDRARQAFDMGIITREAQQRWHLIEHRM